MKISIKYFGRLSEQTGMDHEILELAAPTTVKAVIQNLTSTYSELAKSKFRVAVNQEIGNDEAVLNDGDELALLPPFAGG